jgi:hypothetical protein
VLGWLVGWLVGYIGIPISTYLFIDNFSILPQNEKKSAMFFSLACGERLVILMVVAAYEHQTYNANNNTKPINSTALPKENHQKSHTQTLYYSTRIPLGKSKWSSGRCDRSMDNAVAV